LHKWIERYCVEPKLQLHEGDKQADRLLALLKRTNYRYHPNELTRQAYNVPLGEYEGREFGSLVSRGAEPNRRSNDHPLVRHARRLSEAATTPLRGSQGAPWRAEPFHFDARPCGACKDPVLGYEPQG
jgi:hypothetical protein